MKAGWGLSIYLILMAFCSRPVRAEAHRERLRLERHHLGAGLARRLSDPKLPQGSLIADIYACRPYCAKVGQITSASPLEFEDGLRVEVEDSSIRIKGTWIVPNSSPTKQALLSVANANNGRVGQKTFVIESPEKLLQAKVLQPVFWETHPDRAYEIEHGPWRFGGFDLAYDSSLGRRSLSTSADTEVESDSPFLATWNASLRWKSPWIREVQWLGGFFKPSLFVSGGSSFREAPSTNPYGRAIRSDHLSGGLEINWQSLGSRHLFGFSLGMQQERFRTNVENPFGFSTLSRYGVLGARYDGPWGGFSYKQSVFSGTEDSGDYRGTSVASQLRSLELWYPFWQIAWSDERWRFRVLGLVNLLQTQQLGQGTPASTLFTENPRHNYLTWTVGVRFELSGALSWHQGGLHGY